MSSTSNLAPIGQQFVVGAAGGELLRAYSATSVALEAGTRLTLVGSRVGLRAAPYSVNEYTGFATFRQLRVESGVLRRELLELAGDDSWPDWLEPVDAPEPSASLDPHRPPHACRRLHPGWSALVRRHGDFRAVTKPRYWRLTRALRFDRTDHGAKVHRRGGQVELPPGTRLYYVGVSYAYDGIGFPEAWHILQPLDARGRAGECLTLHRTESRRGVGDASDFPEGMLPEAAA